MRRLFGPAYDDLFYQHHNSKIHMGRIMAETNQVLPDNIKTLLEKRIDCNVQRHTIWIVPGKSIASYNFNDLLQESGD